MLVHFDHTKSLVIILVQDCLDRRRFTGSGITKKQTVISFFTLYKCLGIIDQFLLGNVIATRSSRWTCVILVIGTICAPSSVCSIRNAL